MPAGQGKDAELFAAAVEQETPPGFPVDDELARDMQIVAMLRSSRAAYAPDPDAKARAKQRLMAVLAAENGRQNGASHAPAAAVAPAAPVPPAAAELTAPLARIHEPALPTARNDVDDAVTMQMAAVVEQPEPVSGAEPETAAGPTARPGRRGGRHTMPSRPSRSGASRRPGGRSLRRRTALVGSAAVVVMMVLATAGVFVSRDALPGDNLYAIKRIAESAGLALTFDDEAKARRHLQIATTRIDEMEQLVARGPLTAADSELFTSGFGDFDAAAGQGSRMLLASDDVADEAALAELRSWAAKQSARLSDLRPDLPVPAAAGADGALKMLERLVNRTDALQQRSSCSEMTSGAVDDLGPIPTEGACAPRPADPSEAAGPDETTGIGSGSENDGGTDITGEPGAAVNGGPQGSESGTPGLLPGVGPDGLLLDGPPATGTESAPSVSGAPTPGSDQPSGPATTFPPVTLPPLVPGMPGITLG